MVSVRQIVVVGASAAGATAVETIRRLNPGCSVTLVSDEPVPVYSRCLLSHYLEGLVPAGRLAFRPSGWPDELDVRFIRGRVVEVDHPASMIRLDRGPGLPYDGLLLATGASAVLPDIPGIQTGGVFAPYRLYEVENMLATARQAEHVIVLGAGQVGIKFAKAFAARGQQVTIIEQMPVPLAGALDEPGGRLVRAQLERHGVRLFFNTTIVEVRSLGGQVCEVRLDHGARLPCQLLVVAAGVKPNAGLAIQAGAAAGRGVLVDGEMRTSLEGVYAAGDVAEAPELHSPVRAVLANWLNAVEQGRVAGSNLAGVRRAYPGGLRASTLRLWDLPVLAIGESAAGGGWVLDEQSGYYRKLAVREGFLVGVQQVGGNLRDAGILSACVKRRSPAQEVERLLADGFSGFCSEGYVRQWLAGKSLARKSLANKYGEAIVC
jgi:NAD(P)H-nitrite reductase large subunit